jgi:hypothetical protein
MNTNIQKQAVGYFSSVLWVAVATGLLALRKALIERKKLTGYAAYSVATANVTKRNHFFYC